MRRRPGEDPLDSIDFGRKARRDATYGLADVSKHERHEVFDYFAAQFARPFRALFRLLRGRGNTRER